MLKTQSYSRFTIDDSRLWNDRKVQWILLGGLLVQILFCITAVGFLHPDQHFQVIEFSSYQLGEQSSAGSVWELAAQIRPTLQIYIFSAFIKVCRLLHIDDAYTQLMLLRFIFGLLAFAVFNRIALHYFKDNKRVLYLVLLLLNFSWTLPYIRTMFSSEMTSAVIFFGAVVWYDVNKNKRGYGYTFITGLLFSIAFYLRFQIAFGIAGFGIWMLVFEKKYIRLLPIVAGFLIGAAINLLLDYRFYHQLVFTPYQYYYANIVEGKAAQFGTSSFVRYIIMLAVVTGIPPLSIFLFYYSLKGVVKQYRQPLIITTLFFIIGHCFVGHKEERFLFPVLNILPVIAGWGLTALMQFYNHTSKSIRKFLKGIVIFSIALNTLVLILFILNPYSQTVEFSRQLTNKFNGSTTTVYCLARTPFETESGLPLTFYRRNAPNINLVKLNSNDSLNSLKNAYVATTYNQSKESFSLLDSLHFKPVFYSSAALWKINQFLQSKKINTINDIWVLYKKE